MRTHWGNVVSLFTFHHFFSSAKYCPTYYSAQNLVLPGRASVACFPFIAVRSSAVKGKTQKNWTGSRPPVFRAGPGAGRRVAGAPRLLELWRLCRIRKKSMGKVGRSLAAALEGYAKFLRDRGLAPARQQPDLARRTREFLLFAPVYARPPGRRRASRTNWSSSRRRSGPP